MRPLPFTTNYFLSVLIAVIGCSSLLFNTCGLLDSEIFLYLHLTTIIAISTFYWNETNSKLFVHC